MRIGRELASLLTGIAGGAALALGAPLAASDPPAAAHGAGHAEKAGHPPASTHHQTGEHQQADAPHGTGRWSAPHQYSPDAHHETAGNGGMPAPEVAFRGCAYFENAGYGGRRGEVRDGGNVEGLGRQWDNRISAAACHEGCRLLAYPDINFGGARRVLTGAVANVGHGWDDRISSVRVICEGAGAHEERPPAPH